MRSAILLAESSQNLVQVAHTQADMNIVTALYVVCCGMFRCVVLRFIQCMRAVCTGNIWCFWAYGFGYS